MKFVIVGTNHAGIAAANTILDNYGEGNELVMLDRNSNLSYLGCGTALWVGRQIDGYEGLFYTKPEDFEAKGAKISLETNVEKVDFDKKVVYAKTKDGQEIEESYDKLILAEGSAPIAPNLPGKDLDGIHFLKLFQEGQAVDQELSKDGVDTVAVIGAGYIGVEIAEAARRRGKNVLLFDAEDTCLASYYDKEFSQLMDENLKENGIETHYGEFAQEYLGENGRVTGLKTDKGQYEVDAVINCIGFRPNSNLGEDHLERFGNGAYLVNRGFQTSDPDVYAVGDCATNYSNALQDTTYIALASNAVRAGIVGAHNAAGTAIDGAGVQGSNGIEIFDLKLVSTGLSVKAAKKADIPVKYVDYEDLQLPGFMPEEKNEKVKIRIVYTEEGNRIVGAQLASHYDMHQLIHMFSLAIQEELTMDKLQLLDIFFLPHYNQPYNYVTMAALSADK
ncbi:MULTISPECIES: H2O-forming NADH oxidase [Aerococcus]|uniref:NADH oxidase n=3 Tax=Lactobacillales TaxID=186826 RepID=A0A178HHW4_9LACT|nr:MULTISPECIES: FAD-dependent oxidoreductase [Aerococcus]KAA9220169.1 NADH oxidase [Aerococcus loyolae]KAA9266307.1 NADH oxidase [Aerococcus loyolae]MCY3025195.1 FAD-dependent oxidoreductase [Aerococcus loyolae]MCY3027149.1 FAD-dependent oxidoreductase [Aerococcus loyolae]MCY3029286.1 FAD-dependent oxidoreductase [Aerococcus loyolae]